MKDVPTMTDEGFPALVARVGRLRESGTSNNIVHAAERSREQSAHKPKVREALAMSAGSPLRNTGRIWKSESIRNRPLGKGSGRVRNEDRAMKRSPPTIWPDTTLMCHRPA